MNAVLSVDTFEHQVQVITSFSYPQMALIKSGRDVLLLPLWEDHVTIARVVLKVCMLLIGDVVVRHLVSGDV